MLENEVASIGPLRAIKDQSNHQFLHSGRELTHEKYSNLLLSAATNYDMQFSSSGSQRSRKLYVIYVTESNNSNFYRNSISDFTEENKK